jgi:hypothetical protein
VLNPAGSRPDGTDADYFAMKVLYRGVTKAMMHRFGGLQNLVSRRAHGQAFVSVIAYQPGCPKSNDGLRQDLSSALNDFSLTGTYLERPESHTIEGITMSNPRYKRSRRSTRDCPRSSASLMTTT